MSRHYHGKLCICLLVVFCSTVLSVTNDSKESVADELYNTITERGIEVGITQFHALKKNHSDDYDFSEPEINGLGYRFVLENKLDEAIAVFNLNCELHPGSANAYDSLGEAYLRKGENGKAIERYEKALVLLANPDVDENTKNALTQNAEAKLNYLRSPDIYRSSTELNDFLANNDRYPFGRLNPQAPPETEHWGRLAGEWDCITEARLPSGNWVKVGKAKWLWKYILDGFAVQDLWFQKWIDLRATLASVNRDVVGTNIRMYLPAEDRWEAVWLTNGKNTTSRFEAISDEEKIVMTGEHAQGGLARITFFNITQDNFDWKSERSQDEGASWTETLRIHGKRLR